MKRRAELLLSLVLTTAVLVSISCVDLTDFEDTVDFALDPFGEDRLDGFTESTDPTIVAAGQTDKATQRERDQDETDPLSPEGLMSSALDKLRDVDLEREDGGVDPLSPEGLSSDLLEDLEQVDLGSDSATAAAQSQVDSNPGDPFTRLSLATSQVAAGESPAASKGEARSLYQKFDPQGGADPDREYLSDYLLLLSAALESSEPASDKHGRLRSEYCAQVALWQATYPDSLLAPVIEC